MSVVRTKKSSQKPYVMLDTTALNDGRLSFRAKGLHTYLMSKPDGWQIYIEQLEKTSPLEGRDAIRSAMAELQQAGYVHREKARGDKGRMAGWNTTVYETPALAQKETDIESTAETIGLTELAPTTAQPKSDEPKSDEPKSDEPKSDEPKSDEPKSANPQLVINDLRSNPLTVVIPSPPTEDLPTPPRLTPESLVTMYNLLVPEDHPKVVTISKERRKKLTAAIEQYPQRDFWETVFQEIEHSEFLRGRRPSKGHEHFKATLDWLLQVGKDHTENYVKVYEGKYRDGPLDGLSLAGKMSVLSSQRILEQDSRNGTDGTPAFLAIARRAR